MVEKKHVTGLSSAEAKARLDKYGKNELVPQKKESIFKKIFHIITAPMFLLLIAAAVIYFLLGQPGDGAVMLIFVVAIISIDVIQELKTDKTVKALQDLSAPHISVIRDGQAILIESADLVPGDLMLLFEGVKIPADGVIVRCSDLCVDESLLTGEAEAVWKSETAMEDSADYWQKNWCYAGTLVTQGTATVEVLKTGALTEYGKIGQHIASTENEDTPLQKQTDKLVKVCAIIAGLLLLMVAFFTYMNIADHPFKERLIESILSGITLAMAMIPEEFPVILTVFLSMGAWRLAKKNALIRRLPSVETLGAVSILCVDKTGTITMNQMTMQETWPLDHSENELIEHMGMACETDAYDPMEKAMLLFCEQHGITKESLFSGRLLAEYPFTNELKMMGHVWEKAGRIIITAKGSPERIIRQCDLVDERQRKIEEKVNQMAKDGLRVIAVATYFPVDENDIPENITDCHFSFEGLVGLVDPPREGISKDIALCNQAGIRVVMITGDNGVTAASIAKIIGMKKCDSHLTGAMIDNMSDEELRQQVKNTSIFSRVIPEHKMRIVNAFRFNGEIVAMTGDGVNDAPALKKADIGIAMGKRGSEVSREAADMILMDDNFTTIVETVKDGRRLYDNIKKAIGYVFSIHIPIAFSALLAPILGIPPASLFLLPIHIVLLELLIDPTCSVVLERQPAESNIMKRPPRKADAKILDAAVLTKSLFQGFIIFLAAFGSYCFLLDKNPDNAGLARSMGLTVIMFSNLFLVQVNSSSYDSLFTSIRRLAKDRVMWGANFLMIIFVLIILYTPFSSFLKLSPLSANQLLIALALSALAVLWIEPVKIFLRKSGKKQIK
ncbi:cation-translocating P-type ATPase [Eubacteriaceae bacterium ES2]|nr:cation-translocating P-type ATPase [Eubacteriaceae bacterium ES2]